MRAEPVHVLEWEINYFKEEIMKKILAVFLIALMLFSLIACNSGDGGVASQAPSESGTSSAPAETSSAPSSTQPAPSASGNQAAPPGTTAPPEKEELTFTGNFGDDPLDMVGWYDPDYNYAANPTYVVQYMVANVSVLNQQASDAFEHWAGLMNVEYRGMWAASGDNDLYLSTIPLMAADVDGFVFDPDSSIIPRVAEITDELGKPWMCYMSKARADNVVTAPLIHPNVGFDNYYRGTLLFDKLMEFKDRLWPDVPMEDFGFLCVDYSLSVDIHDRYLGCLYSYQQAGLPEDHFFLADCASGKFDTDTASQLTSAMLAAQPQFEYWLISAANDDLAMGAAAAVETFGLTDNTAAVSCGGSGLQVQFDAGVQTAWRSANFSPNVIFAEGVLGALYAFMSGRATPETIWPSWINVNDRGDVFDSNGNLVKEGSYARVLLPTYWIEFDNYQHFLRWSDIYAGFDYFSQYPSEGINKDDYSARADIPSYYSVKN